MLGTIQSNCNNSGVPYTGIGSCPKKEGKVSALLLTGVNAFYPMDKDEFVQGLSGYVTTNDALKMYPVKGVVGLTINGGDINAPELGTYGGAMPTNLNAKNVAYQIDAGDCLYKELSKLNKRKMRVFRVDDEGYVYGTVVVRDGVNYFAGFEATVYTVRTSTDGSTAYNLSLYAYYTPNNESEEQNMNAFDVGLPNIPDGLLGVILKAGTNGTASVMTACGGEDITAEYGDDWEASMFINESGTAATTATFNSATGLLTIAPAGKYRIAGASVLESGNIFGLDGVPEYADITASA